MATITFKGLVTAWQSEPYQAYQLIICCMARISSKNYLPISLEGNFKNEIPDKEPQIGSLAYGEAKILEIWDGSILVEFRKDKFQTMPSDSCVDFNGESLKYIYAPRADRQMRLQAKEFYRRRIFPEYYPNQLNWNISEQPFGRLGLYALAIAGDSMAEIEGDAIFITKLKNAKNIKSLRNCIFETEEYPANKRLSGSKKVGKSQEKFALFLLAGMTCDIHNPTFMIARMEKNFPLNQGQIYHFKNLPILAVEDNNREEESTIICGSGIFHRTQYLYRLLLWNLYTELGNCEMMPADLWKKYFYGKLDRTDIQRLKKDIGELLPERRIALPKQVHGWWYYWETVHKLQAPGEEELAVLAPAFRDGGPVRVIILPMRTYKSLRKNFPIYSSAVSVSKDPQIIEGAYSPEPGNWELLKSWIIRNQQALEKNWLDIDDLQFEKDRQVRDDNKKTEMNSKLFSSADLAIKEYKKSGSEIIGKILRAYDSREFAGEEYKILPIIEKEAANGNSIAQTILAEVYLYGGVKAMDIEQAIFWLEKAIDPKGRMVSYDIFNGFYDGPVEYIKIDRKAQLSG